MIGHVITHLGMAAKRIAKHKRPLAAVPNIDDKQFLFIGGMHRSGTSILHRLLCEHPLASGFADTGVFEDEGQHLQSVFPAAASYGGPGRFAFDLRARLTEASELIIAGNRDLLLRQWGAYYDLDKTIFLEKSPPNLIRARFFQQLFPDARFVFIVRHPVAVALATRKWLNTSVLELFLHWHVAHVLMLEDLEYLNNYLVLRYEDFVVDSQSYLDRIYKSLDVERVEPTEQVKNHNAKYFSTWEHEFGEQIAMFESILPGQHSPLATFGYSFSTPYYHADSNLPMEKD